MPNRELREGILTSERVNALGFAAEIFYRRLMSVVDDYGRFHAHPTLLKAACYPLKLDEIHEPDILNYLAECQTCGLLTLYTINGKKFLELIDFRNRKRALHSKYPGNPDPPTMTGELPPTVGQLCQVPTSHSDAIVGDFCEIPTDAVRTVGQMASSADATQSRNSETSLSCPSPDRQPPLPLTADAGHTSVTSATRSENRETIIENVVRNSSSPLPPSQPPPPPASSRAQTSPSPFNAPPGEGTGPTSSLDSHAALGKLPPSPASPGLPSPNQSQSVQSVDPSPPKRRSYPADNEFIAALKANPAYTRIDIDREINKARAWLLTPAGRGRQLTRKFIVNWLNRTDAPLLPEKIAPAKSPEQIEKIKNETARAEFIHQLAARIQDGLSRALITEARALNPAELRLLFTALPLPDRNRLTHALATEKMNPQS